MCLTGCQAYGAEAIRDAFLVEIDKKHLGDSVEVVETGCHGFCSKAPALVIDPFDVFYQEVSPEDVPEIVETTVRNGTVIERLTYLDPQTGERIAKSADIPFYQEQARVVMRNLGRIDPKDIDQYIRNGGYGGLATALKGMTPERVIDELEASGLRGRGGGGFATFLKWQLARKERARPKYLICNGDEGDPGVFMDRSIMEGDPHAVIEGMLIGGYAIGAEKGYIYVRADYPIAVEHLKLAISQACESGLLGDRILGTKFGFDIEVKEGVGAFVCGEETALIASIEGRRGTPRLRPPFPTQSGLWGKPTCVNNVETLSSVPVIITKGAQAYRDLGVGKACGTKIFSLSGKVNNAGLVEAPMGLPLRNLIFDIGGGVMGGKKFKAVQMGGPSGGFVLTEHLDLPVTYDSIAGVGAPVGSGGVIVLDENNCLVDTARYFIEFGAEESCGKCTPCRVGTKRMLEVLTRMTKGQAVIDDIALLNEVATVVKDASFCGLGRNAPNPVLSSLRFFEAEFEEHIREKTCRAYVCQDLYTAPCVNTCPVNTDARGYIIKISEGRYDDALAIAKARNPFPSICGRVCHHPCEGRCRRSDIDEAVAIRSLKRFITDYAKTKSKEQRASGSGRSVIARTPTDQLEDAANSSMNVKPKRVAVIGAGPSGLAAANDLSQRGYAVTVLEANSAPGGAMLTGIPSYRLPRDILAREIEDIEAGGVRIKLNTKLGREVTLPRLKKEFDAVLVAAGAGRNNKLHIPGENTPGALYGLDFLRKVNLGKKVTVGKRVLVVGGGNVAIDSARSAVRLGARDVTILYRRGQEEMPADVEEIADALAEGVALVTLVAPVAIKQRAAGLAVKCVRMALGQADASGRRRSVPVSGSEHDIETDTVIVAAGYGPDHSVLKDNSKDVFACGDFVNGATTVIQAVASGLAAAEKIDRYLRGDQDSGETTAPSGRLAGVLTTTDPGKYQTSTEYRHEPKKTPPRTRSRSFAEAEAGYTEKEAVAEARRCLHCNLEQEDE
ncbi:MAG: FAD-dependent oxidoreductase, partial [Actinomycetota bacterium]